jgi:hypothetical protein
MSFSINQKVAAHFKSIFAHLFQNTLDHGLESSQERLAKGKEGPAKIEIFSYIRENQANIVYRDNGRGLNISIIRKKAVQFNLFTNEFVFSNLEEIANLLFSPGFYITCPSGNNVSSDPNRSISQVGFQEIDQLMHEMDGEVRIILFSSPQKDPEYYPFEIKLSFPITLTKKTPHCGPLPQ